MILASMKNRIKLYIGFILFAVSISSCNKEKKVPIYEHFWAPDSFSPNGDAYNDNFRITSRYGIIVPEYHISIYDQNLHLVYQGDDLNDVWNGKLNGMDTPEGYYDYQIVYKASQLLDSTSIDTIYSDYITTSKINLMR